MKGSWYEKPYLDEQHLALTGICVQVHVYKASCLKHLIVCLLFCFVDFVEIQGPAFCQIRDSNFLQYATPFPDKPRWAYLPRTTLKSDLLCIVTPLLDVLVHYMHGDNGITGLLLLRRHAGNFCAKIATSCSQKPSCVSVACCNPLVQFGKPAENCGAF